MKENNTSDIFDKYLDDLKDTIKILCAVLACASISSSVCSTKHKSQR